MGTTTVSIEEVRAQEGKEEREESILALLGIIGTFLNLFVIVFVYIYTTLWEGSTWGESRWRWGAEIWQKGWHLTEKNVEDDTGLLRTGEVTFALELWHFCVYINLDVMDACLTQISGHTESDSWICTLAGRGHGTRDLEFPRWWELHRALPCFNCKDTGTQKEPIGQTQEHDRMTERLFPNLYTNRKSFAIKWKNWNSEIFFYWEQKREWDTPGPICRFEKLDLVGTDSSVTFGHFSTTVPPPFWLVAAR